ncbi:MAG: hypothetical protein ACE5D7_06120 [Fidelibacterota bacterium]
MSEVNICSSCGCEYRPDIDFCMDCNMPLGTTNDDSKKTQQLMDESKLIAVATGSVKNIRPLVDILEENQFLYKIQLSETITEAPHPDSDFLVMIEEKDVPRFNELVENFKYQEFPELSVAKDLMDSGCCPACGAKVGDETICPECELPLIIVEDDDKN